jgi:ribonuclease D
VLHSARQDLEVLYQRCGRLPAVLVDTQVGAALLGYPLQIGLQRLLQDLLGISLGKEHTRTDWSRRPLPEAALQYAVDDVRYLLPAWRAIEQRLDDAGRSAWFVEDCDRALHLPIQPDAAAILERTRGAGGLRGRQRDAAIALVDWRENRARERNKPRRWILADDQLVRIAAALPGSVAELEQLSELPARLVSRSGKALVTVVAEAEPVPDAQTPPPPDKAVVKALQQDVRAAAEAIGVQPELLATRREIGLAAAGHPPPAFTSGWRSALLGDLARRVSPGQSS